MVRRRFLSGNATWQRPSWASLMLSFASVAMLLCLGTPADAEQGSIAIELELADTSCDQVGSFFINDVIECKAESGPVSELPEGHHGIQSNQ